MSVGDGMQCLFCEQKTAYEVRISGGSSDVCSSDLSARPAPATRLGAAATGRNGQMASEKLFGLHATALQLRSQRMMMLASNIANAATPNYKALDLDFAKSFALANQRASTAGHIDYLIPFQSPLHGHTVELSTDQPACPYQPLSYP